MPTDVPPRLADVPPRLAAGLPSEPHVAIASAGSIARLVGACALAVVLLGTLGLLGWIVDARSLTSFWPGLATMKANTALGLILSGAALWLLRRAPRPRASALLAAIVGTMATLTLIEYAAGCDLGIDQLLFVDTASHSPGDAPGRMSGATALGLALVALAVYSLDRAPRLLSPSAALMGLAVAFIALTGYAYGVHALYRVGPFASVALPTATALLLLSGGLLLARPNRGLVGFTLGEGAGPSLLRRLMPWAVGIPFLLGLAQVAAVRSGLFPAEFGTAVFGLSQIGLLLVVIVWTARRVAATEAQLERVSARDRLYSAVVASTSDAIAIQTPDGTITEWNAAAERLYGYPASEVLGRTIALIFPQARARIEQAGQDERLDPWITAGQTRSGKAVDVSVSFARVRDMAGTVVAVATIARDITEQRQAEARFRAAVEACPSGMILVDPAGTIVLANTETSRLFGRPAGALVGTTVDALFPERFRDGHGDLLATFRGATAAGALGAGREGFGLRADGSEFPLEIRLNPVELADGAFTLATILDMTERKRRDDELLRSNAELEQFAYVASHDLQEPLRMVASYTELLRQRYEGKLDERADKYIHYAVDGAKRMQRLVADLLAYSRVGSQGKPLVPVDAGKAFAVAQRSLAAAIREAGATVDATSPLPMVLADEGQLCQLLQNLIANAVKFRAERAPRVLVSAALKDGRWQFAVADNGIGIEAQYSERVFQMFQRLQARGTYKGSGIGLAIAKRIVERHGGKVWFESQPGEGTTFFFTLAAASGAP